MNMRMVVVAALATGMWMTVTASAAPPVTLAKDGAAAMPILAGSDKAPAEELQAYLKRICGADFAIQPAQEAAKGIYVGTPGDFPWLKLGKTDDLGAEGFLLRTDGTNLYLIAADARGVPHAVVALLQRLGCRWFFPGKNWEVVPTAATITVSADERQTPSFTTQRTVWYGFGVQNNTGKDLAAWKRHNRMGGTINASIGHSWYGIESNAANLEAHPEWFAMVNGVRKTSKPCFSNEEVLQRAIQYALAAAEKSGGKGMVTMTPDDGLGYCECDKCLAVLQGGPKDEELTKRFSTCFGTRPDGLVVNVTSETLFAFVNKVAEAVAAKYPDMLLGCYAYSAYSHPPSFKMHPNVYIQTTNGMRRTPLSLEDQMTQWGKLASKVDIREYWSVYQSDWDNPYPLGRMLPQKMQELLRSFRKWNATGVNPEASDNWAARGLGYYAAAAMLWNLDTDLKALTDDFYAKAFGPAEAPMRRYFARWYDRPEGKDQPRLNLAAEMPAVYKNLDEAVALAKDSPSHLARVNDIRMYAHYLHLRTKVAAAIAAKDKDAVLETMKAETVFGGRLIDTNMIHVRPLIGKAFQRRFAAALDVLEVPKDPKDVRENYGKEWRKIGTAPTAKELDELWAQDKAEMAK